jgi:hypothetical protein
LVIEMNTTTLLDRLSLKRLLRGALMSALLGVFFLGAVSIYESHRGNVLATELARDVRTARAAGLVDMMHDALRSDALSALLAGPQAEAAEAAAIRKDAPPHGKSWTSCSRSAATAWAPRAWPPSIRPRRTVLRLWRW